MSSQKFGKTELLEYVKLHKLAVVATIGERGEPQAALVGVGAMDDLELVFDTLSTSRKHANLRRENRIAITFGGPGERTLQLEGLAFPVSMTDEAGAAYREKYYETWPDGRDRVQWPDLVYWRIRPQWARYSEYDGDPLVVEFRW